MRLSKTLSIFRQENRISQLFPITHLNSPSIFETQSGVMGTVIKVEGAAFELQDAQMLNSQHFLLHQALLNLDERFLIYVTTHRRKISCELKGEYNSYFLKTLDANYHARFKTQSFYENDWYLTLLLRSPGLEQSLFGVKALSNWVHKKNKDLLQAYREKQVHVLKEARAQFAAQLQSFGAVILGEENQSLEQSSLLNFLSLVINAGQSLPFKFPSYSPPLAQDLPATLAAESRYPCGHLGPYLSRYQLLFGEYLQFQGNTEEEKKFGAMLSLKKYPSSTFSLLLAPLLALDGEWISTHSFAALSRESGLKRIADKRGKFLNAEDKALGQITALTELEDQLASQSLLLGFHHHSLMLLAPSIGQLEQIILEATKHYGTAGISVIKESSLGLEPSFWSQIPGNQALIARASLITSENFIDFCPFHNLQKGFGKNNFLGGAITLLETPYKTPVFFNYHVKGSKTNPPKGHAAILGGSNAGKTTLVNFLDAQMGRFAHRSFYLDRDESSKIYILASGNSSYLKIAPGHPLAMNPFKLADHPENRGFLKAWLSSLILKEGELSLDATLTQPLHEAVDYAFEQLAPEHRRLSTVTALLTKDFPRWSELRRWLKGSQDHGFGEYHWLFDNEADALDFNFDKIGIDLTYLMDNLSASISNPVYFYLLHRMDQTLDGRLTSIVVEEAWQVFASLFWESSLKARLPTIRKKNGHFIFLTQSPKTITSSALSEVILDNLATLIILPNPMADEETYIHHLKLSPVEYEAMKNYSPSSRVFLYKQEKEAMLCKLDLSQMQSYVSVLSGNIHSIKYVDELIKTYGLEPECWLPMFLKRSQ